MPRAPRKVVMCERKAQHKTLSAAQEHLERLKSLPDVTDAERLHIYWCPFPDATGRHRHVGHRRKLQQEYLKQRGLI